jgi:transcriptional regulator with XRE-family HTH domain
MLAYQVAALVKERRMLRQLTQSELAALAEVSRTAVARLERPGRRCVRIDVADRVLRALGIRVDVAVYAPARPRGRPGVGVLH